MDIDSRKLNRFNELLILGEKVLQTKYKVSLGDFGVLDQVDDAKSYEWAMKCLALLEEIFGKGSLYYNQFKDLFEGFTSIAGYDYARRAFAVLKAAKEDYENGFAIEFVQEQNENGISVDGNSQIIATIIDKEAKRNTRLYLIVIFESLLFISSLFFYFFGIKNASVFSLIILIISYLISAFSLKEWTPTKLPERIFEIEKNRIYKNFGVDSQ